MNPAMQPSALAGKQVAPDLMRRRSSRLQAQVVNNLQIGKDLSYVKDHGMLALPLANPNLNLADSLFEAGNAY